MVIKSESPHKNSELEYKICNNTKSSYQTEVLESWYVSQHANKECESFTKSGCENGGTYFFKCKCDS
jgi:hypothetical protein